MYRQCQLSSCVRSLRKAHPDNLIHCSRRHSTFDRQYGGRAGALLPAIKKAVVAYLNDPDCQPYRIQALMQHLHGLFAEADIPDEKSVRTFVMNWKQRADAPSDRAGKHQWTKADFVAAARSLPPMDIRDADLALVHFATDPTVELVVCSPRIVRRQAACCWVLTFCSHCLRVCGSLTPRADAI